MYRSLLDDDLRKNTTRGRKQNTKKILKILPSLQLASSGTFGQMRFKILRQGLQTWAGKFDTISDRTEGLDEDGRKGNAERGHKKKHEQSIACSGKDRAPCQANASTENEDDGPPQVAPPEVFFKEVGQTARNNTEILGEAVDQTHCVHASVEDVSEIEHNSNGTTKLGTQRARDQVVCTATSDGAVGCNGGERHCRDQVDQVGNYKQT